MELHDDCRFTGRSPLSVMLQALQASGEGQEGLELPPPISSSPTFSNFYSCFPPLFIAIPS